MSSYEQFIASKALVAPPTGIDDVPELHPMLFPFQRECVAWALKRGRAALFEECGLGKTFQQLEWARVVAQHTGGRVLIFAPLAVAQQTIREATKLGVTVRYVGSQEDVQDGISITNYERVDRFDGRQFAGVVLDESSILKSFMGKTKRALVDAFAHTPFRLACTATPAPNDHIELGNHSEFLGVLASFEMLTRFFINDTSLFGNYRLKGHAEAHFWDWVCSWARCVTKPSDLGHPDDGFVLPKLYVNRHVVQVDVREGRGANLFRVPDLSATSIHREKRITATTRAQKIADLVASEPDEDWLVWCDTDYEADALLLEIPEAVEVRGSHSQDVKEAAVAWFLGWRDSPSAKPGPPRTRKGKVLITKSSIFGLGLNFQSCARVAFVGASFSYEQFHQAIRRSWRFGQTRDVHAHVAMAATEVDVWNVMVAKQASHDGMGEAMAAAMKRAYSRESKRASYLPTHVGTLPAWLRRKGAA